MSHRPQPPATTESPSELAAFVEQNPEEWLLYFRNLNAYLTQVEEAHGDQAVQLEHKARDLEQA